MSFCLCFVSPSTHLFTVSSLFFFCKLCWILFDCLSRSSREVYFSRARCPQIIEIVAFAWGAPGLPPISTFPTDRQPPEDSTCSVIASHAFLRRFSKGEGTIGWFGIHSMLYRKSPLEVYAVTFYGQPLALAFWLPGRRRKWGISLGILDHVFVRTPSSSPTCKFPDHYDS